MLPVSPDEKERENRHPDGHAYPARRHRRVEEDDVENDRAKNRQTKDWEHVSEKEKSANDLAEKHHCHETGTRDGRKKLAGRAIRRGQFPHRDEMEKSIEAEDDKGQAEQRSHDYDGDFHVERWSVIRKNKEDLFSSDSAPACCARCDSLSEGLVL